MTLFQLLGFLSSDYPGDGGGGGGTPIFSYIFKFGALFLVQNFRNNTFGSMKICGYFFWGGVIVITKSDYFLFFSFFFFFFFFFFGGGVISIHFRVF